MRRREFVGWIGATAAWASAARAQRPSMPIVGYLYAGTPEQSASSLTAFRKGLSDAGYVEGRNVAIEYRWANNETDRLPELAADLVRRRVSVIAAPGSVSATLAAKDSTATIPIVFMFGADPVQIGAVSSLNRPGGNVTGVTSMGSEIGSKRLGLIHELLPKAKRFGALLSASVVSTTAIAPDLRAAASAVGVELAIANVSSNAEIDTAFADFARTGIDAIVLSPSALFFDRNVQLVTLATHYRLPAIYPFRESVLVGGLMSYGTGQAELYRQVGVYTGRILKGEKPGDLPVMRATKFEFVINLHAAKTLGLEMPPGLLAIADDVIE